MAAAYDNSAFVFFLLSLMALYLVPASLMVGYRLVKGLFFSKRKAGDTSDYHPDAAKKSPLTKGLFIHAMVLVVLWSIFFVLARYVGQHQELAAFDPYAVLGISHGATTPEIRRAYRQLSIEFHPDKFKGDPDIFIRIRKAYEALTDPVARENFEKYGNPDGAQPMEVSIGLPTFLLQEQNKKLVLLAYWLGIVIFVPLGVWLWYRRSQRSSGAMALTVQRLAQYFAQCRRLVPEQFVEAYCLAAEFEETLQLTPDQQRPLMELYDKVKRSFHGKLVKSPNELSRPDIPPHMMTVFKCNVILTAHMDRKDIPPEFAQDLDFLLRNAEKVLKAMLACSADSPFFIHSVLRFAQMLTQGLYPTISPLRQLPHLTPAHVRRCRKGKDFMTPKDFARKPVKEARHILQSYPPDQVEEIMRACKRIPDLSVKVEPFVEGETKIAQKDLVTLRVTLTRENLEEGQRAGMIYAPHFPVPRREVWWLLLLDEKNKMVGSAIISDDHREVVDTSIKFVAPIKPRIHPMRLFVVSDAYVGSDELVQFKLNVVPAASLPELELHAEDRMLDEELEREVEDAGNASDSAADSDSDNDSESEADEDGAERISKRRARNSGVAASSSTPKAPAKLEDTLTEAELRRRNKRLARRQKKQPDGTSPDAAASPANAVADATD